MNIERFVSGVALCCLAACAFGGAGVLPSGAATSTVGSISDQTLAKVVPGKSSMRQVQSLLGAPWRVVQFNDCGGSMDHQADETWDYRGKDSTGKTYRVHIEFDDHKVAHLVAKIPDSVPGGKGTLAKVAPTEPAKRIPMSAKSMRM